jgi:hypothetical protein
VHRAIRGWLFPYIRSRVLPGDFHPITAYLFGLPARFSMLSARRKHPRRPPECVPTHSTKMGAAYCSFAGERDAALDFDKNKTRIAQPAEDGVGLGGEQRYRERESFQFNGGSSEFAASFRYAPACSAALSLPCSISSTGSEGAIQLLVLTLYTDACTP